MEIKPKDVFQTNLSETDESLIEKQQKENPLKELRFRRYSAFHRAFKEHEQDIICWYGDNHYWVLVLKRKES